MESVVNAVLPVFAIMLCGYLAARTRLLGEESLEALNRFVFYLALPVLLFHSVARVEPTEIFNWSFIGDFAGILMAMIVFGEAALLPTVIARVSQGVVIIVILIVIVIVVGVLVIAHQDAGGRTMLRNFGAS